MPALTRRLLALGGVAALAGCRSPEPVLYTILPQPGTQRRGGPRTVAVREVSLARYLDRLQIVRSANEFRLDVAGNDWWGESLDAMLTRVLVGNLAQRLPASSVVATGGAITVSAPISDHFTISLSERTSASARDMGPVAYEEPGSLFHRGTMHGNS